MKIKVKLHNGQEELKVIDKGEWIDLRAPKDMTLLINSSGNFRLDYSMEIPRGYEAIIAPRSSTFYHYGLLMTNGIGVIDSSYCGNDDVWRFPFYCIREASIARGDRVCQFRLQLSQKATVWQKLKWLFTSKIEFEYMDRLGGENRGGIGETGRNEIKE